MTPRRGYWLVRPTIMTPQRLLTRPTHPYDPQQRLLTRLTYLYDWQQVGERLAAAGL